MIVGIGANVYDTLITLSDFPCEDTKMRADGVKVSGGGPCATGLCAAAKLGAKAAFIGTLADDVCGQFLMSDMAKYGLDNSFINTVSGYAAFTSYIWLNKKNATRTCVFDKGNIPSLELTAQQKNAIVASDILMVDGNELDAAVNGAQIANANGTKVLYDAGGLYDGVERLLSLTDILIPSAEYAMGHTNTADIETAARALFEKYTLEIVVVTDGKNGGVMYDGNEVWHYPAFPVKAVDSNGAGDVFHGAFAFGLQMGYDYKKCCIFSSAVSALKCMGVGARESMPSFEDVIEFLKERGINEL